MPPPEPFLIIRKLQFFREGGSQKHLRDISRMLTSLGDDWCRDDLNSFIRDNHLDEEWKRTLSE